MNFGDGERREGALKYLSSLAVYGRAIAFPGS